MAYSRRFYYFSLIAASVTTSSLTEILRTTLPWKDTDNMTLQYSLSWFHAFLMIQQMLQIWSLVPLPFLNPAWTSGSSRFTYDWSLAWRILSITLLALEKTLESPLDSKEIQPVYPKGNQSWIFIGRTDAEAETPILWPPDVKNWLIWKDPLPLEKPVCRSGRNS